MATVQASSAVAAQPCQATVADMTDGKKTGQVSIFPELQRNSLVSEDTNGNSDALTVLREQLHSQVSSSAFVKGGTIGSVTKSLTDERCSTPLVSHPSAGHQFRSIGHSLSSMASPIPRQTVSAPCSPRNGLTVLQSLNAGQLTSPVHRMVSTSSAHPSSYISSFTSSTSGSSVFAPLSAGRGLINSHNPPGTPPQFKTGLSNLLSPLGIAAHAAHVARSGAADSMSSPSTSPRPGILRKRNSDGVSKVTAAAVAAISASSAAKLDLSSKSSQTSVSPALTAAATPRVSISDSPAPARKKPRKQNMVATEDPLASNVPPAETRTAGLLSGATSTAAPASQPKESIQQFPYRRRMPANFGTGYKSTASLVPKSSLNHFQRSSDVRIKDEKRPTIAELSAHRSRLHDMNGWKIDHFVNNLDTLLNMEKNKLDIVNSYLKQVVSTEAKDTAAADELHLMTELLKGNRQRSIALVEQIEEAKQHLCKFGEHRPQVLKLFSKYNGHRGSSGSSSSATGNGKRKG